MRKCASVSVSARACPAVRQPLDEVDGYPQGVVRREAPLDTRKLGCFVRLRAAASRNRHPRAIAAAPLRAPHLRLEEEAEVVGHCEGGELPGRAVALRRRAEVGRASAAGLGTGGLREKNEQEGAREAAREQRREQRERRRERGRGRGRAARVNEASAESRLSPALPVRIWRGFPEAAPASRTWGWVGACGGLGGRGGGGRGRGASAGWDGRGGEREEWVGGVCVYPRAMLPKDSRTGSADPGAGRERARRSTSCGRGPGGVSGRTLSSRTRPPEAPPGPSGAATGAAARRARAARLDIAGDSLHSRLARVPAAERRRQRASASAVAAGPCVSGGHAGSGWWWEGEGGAPRFQGEFRGEGAGGDFEEGRGPEAGLHLPAAAGAAGERMHRRRAQRAARKGVREGVRGLAWRWPLRRQGRQGNEATGKSSSTDTAPADTQGPSEWVGWDRRSREDGGAAAGRRSRAPEEWRSAGDGAGRGRGGTNASAWSDPSTLRAAAAGRRSFCGGCGRVSERLCCCVRQQRRV